MKFFYFLKYICVNLLICVFHSMKKLPKERPAPNNLMVSLLSGSLREWKHGSVVTNANGVGVFHPFTVCEGHLDLNTMSESLGTLLILCLKSHELLITDLIVAPRLFSR